MNLSSTASADPLNRGLGLNTGLAENSGALSCAVSWGAVVAGAVAAASLSLILLILGVGLGLSSVSPWARDGINAATFGVSTILWLTLTQLLASAMGGYLAGRLRTKWVQAHSDEVYFRDTAHGFLAWAVATLATAALLSSVISSIISGGAQAGASVVGAAADTAGLAVAGSSAPTRMSKDQDGGPIGYFVDSLFRPEPASAAASAVSTGSTSDTEAKGRYAGQQAAEVSRIFMNVSRTQPLPTDDVSYVGHIVAQRTGLSQADAEKRVNAVYAKAQAKLQQAEVALRDNADKARKASAYSALWLFISLLVGAFVASLAATFGGRLRDT